MRTYQLVVVLKTSLKEADRKKFVETVKTWVKGAKFTKEENWGEKELAYTIKRENSGFYLSFIFDTEDADVKELEKKLIASDNVLRQLLLRVK